jgi:hypothetical protein
MCPQNYHRELLTLCKHGGNQTLTNHIVFLNLLCKQGIAGSIPATATNHLP